MSSTHGKGKGGRWPKQHAAQQPYAACPGRSGFLVGHRSQQIAVVSGFLLCSPVFWHRIKRTGPAPRRFLRGFDSGARSAFRQRQIASEKLYHCQVPANTPPAPEAAASRSQAARLRSFAKFRKNSEKIFMFTAENFTISGGNCRAARARGVASYIIAAGKGTTSRGRPVRREIVLPSKDTDAGRSNIFFWVFFFVFARLLFIAIVQSCTSAFFCCCKMIH